MLAGSRIFHPIGRVVSRRTGEVAFSRKRPLCSSSSSSLRSTAINPSSNGYIDEWFASIVKPKAFYEKHANRTPTRCYFYNIDLQGRLFLEETLPKNIATSIKDTRFLDFFFKRLKPITEQEQTFLHGDDDNDIAVIVDHEYPYVSPCGKELNFVRPAATPIIYHSLVETTTSNRLDFVYGGTLVQPFDEENGIAISRETGRLYHKLTTHSLLSRSKDGSQQYGLIRSSVAVTLSDRIVPMDNDDCHGEEAMGSGLGFETKDRDGLLPIPWLPAEAEPGQWAMPFIEDE